jgi:hypothetical protein
MAFEGKTMARTIAWLGLSVSFLWLACGASRTKATGDAAADSASSPAKGGAGVGGGAAGMAGAAAGAGGGSKAGGGAGGAASGGAGVAGGGAGATGAAADAASVPEDSGWPQDRAAESGPAESGAGMQDSAVSDGRGDQPLTEAQATALYRDYVNDPVSVYSLEELQVPGAWDATGIQLFSVGFVDEFGYVVNLRPFVAFDGKLYPVTKYPSGGLLSAVLMGDTMYFTMQAGSGISYSVLGKIWVSDAGLQILQGADYATSSDLYLQESDGQVVVEMCGLGSTFNSCTSLGVFGWLRDDGAIVVAVDDAGTVIPYRSVGGW